MKKPYSDYVRHCMTYYIENTQKIFYTEVDKANWEAVDEALKQFSRDEVNILMFIYRQRSCTMREAIDKALFGSDMKRNRVWGMITRLEEQIASKRGL